MFIATPTGICTYLHNVDTKRGDWRGLSAAFDKPVYGEGKVLPVTARLIVTMCTRITPYVSALPSTGRVLRSCR